MAAPPLDLGNGQYVSGETRLPTLCRALGQRWSEPALADRIRVSLRRFGLLSVWNIRNRDRHELEQIFAAAGIDFVVLDKLEQALLYGADDDFKFTDGGGGAVLDPAAVR